MNTRAANRYAKALLDLALEQKQEDAVFNDMQDITKSIIGSNDLQIMLSNPIINDTVKKTTLDSIFSKLSPLSKKLIDLLTENKRLALLQAVTTQFTVLYNTSKGIVKATVTTAVAIDDIMRKQVLAKATKLAKGKEIALENKIDPDILGGFILRVGDIQIDASIANKLNKLKREFKENIYTT